MLKLEIHYNLTNLKVPGIVYFNQKKYASWTVREIYQISLIYVSLWKSLKYYFFPT